MIIKIFYLQTAKKSKAKTLWSIWAVSISSAFLCSRYPSWTHWWRLISLQLSQWEASSVEPLIAFCMILPLSTFSTEPNDQKNMLFMPIEIIQCLASSPQDLFLHAYPDFKFMANRSSKLKRNNDIPTLARVKATLILCQSPSNDEAQFLGFSLDLTNETSIQSLSLPCRNEIYSM